MRTDDSASCYGSGWRSHSPPGVMEIEIERQMPNMTFGLGGTASFVSSDLNRESCPREDRLHARRFRRRNSDDPDEVDCSQSPTPNPAVERARVQPESVCGLLTRQRTRRSHAFHG